MPCEGLAGLLQCPGCRRASLRAADGTDRCDACGASYPRVGGVPWLFPDPARALGSWRNRLGLYLDELEAAARTAEADLAGRPAPRTQARVATLAAAYRDQARRVAELLEPLSLAALPLPHATPLAFGVALPLVQDLHAYYTNLHRDWCWGGRENAAALRLVAGALQAPRARLLVLGAGGGRLAYDLHQSGASSLTVALDINPLLLLTAARVTAGNTVELYEFPIAPRTADDVARRRCLTAPARAREGLEFVFADAWHAPFAPQSFDAIVTPWLLDVVEPAPDVVASAINRLLKPDGRWVNFGSLAFPWRRPSRRLAAPELFEAVEGAGFALVSNADAELPYMQSPASRHGRVEEVLVFAADKLRRAPRGTSRSLAPTWRDDPSMPVPQHPTFALAGEAARIRAIVLALVDGQRSVADLVQIVVQQGLLPQSQAESAVRDLLERLDEEDARYGGP